VKGMDGAFRLSIALAAVAAPASLVRGKEVRRSLEAGLSHLPGGLEVARWEVVPEGFVARGTDNRT